MKDNLCATVETAGTANRFLHFVEEVGIWSVNPYRQCQHRCLYCLAGSQGESSPWYPAGSVIPAFRMQLPKVPLGSELFIGAMVDAYPPIEKGLGVTRLIIHELVDQERPCCITTKSDLVTRDIDLLLQHPGHCDVAISLCSLDDDSLWLLEPGAPSSTERLLAVEQLQTAGIAVMIDASPWIPGISDAWEIIVRRPDNVPVQFAPLDVRHSGGTMTLLGRKYTQEEIDDSYCRLRDEMGHIDGITWKDPLLV